MAENLIRLPMDEIDQYKAFAALVKKGMDAADIAARFAISKQAVTQRLALGTLLPPILALYRKEEIGAASLRILTMATKAQQRAWLSLYRDDPNSAPQGYRLKSWLFGGSEIKTDVALFDLETYSGAVIRDLFGCDSYFDDAELFWTQQNLAIAALKQSLEQEGWADVILLETGTRFAAWDYVDTALEDGGKVYIQVSHNGEVTVFKGQLSRKDIRKAKSKTENAKPELTKPAQNYIDLHRHAAVRADLLGHHSLALRLIAAHMLSSSGHWTVYADPQKAAREDITDSLSQNTGQQAFEAERSALADLLKTEAETALARKDYQAGFTPRPTLCEVFEHLQTLSDSDILRLLTFLMAESLSATSPIIDSLGATLGAEMAKHWSPDSTLFELIRDKTTLNAMVRDYAGTQAAEEHLTATAKTHRTILSACLDGTRTPADPNWMPRYMAFPQGSYREDKTTVETDESVRDAPENQAKAA
ncbi:hypothetical protein [Epibacterium ulvae]|uniref:hypothetical protein n=1 Tax=Epibacterium ulvae TaxID=1156985 RepID=UPI0024904D7D|nr:hypothetical protein [Epibacterium ulvae]